MYNKCLKIMVFTKDANMINILENITPLPRFHHKFIQIKNFLIEDCTVADIVIFDLPLQSLPLGIKKYFNAPYPEIIFCEREKPLGNMLEESGLLADFDFIWQPPFNEAYLKFSFSQVLQKIKLVKDYWLSQNYLNSLIDSVPDMIWFKDVRGSHLKVNNSFCRVVGKTKAQCFDRGHYYIWNIDAEEYSKGEYVCLESEELVIKARETCSFEEKIKGHDGTMMHLKTYKSPIFDDDGSIIGTLGAARDITDWKNIDSELHVIIDSLPSSALLVDAVGKILTVNQALGRAFGNGNIVGLSYNEWKMDIMKIPADLKRNSNLALEFNYSNNNIISTFEIYEEPIYDVFKNLSGYFCLFMNITEHKNHLRLLNNYKEQLEIDVRSKTYKIKEMQKQILISFADLLGSRDNITGQHIRNTSKYVDVIITSLRENTEITELTDIDYCDNISRAAPMHDIGKIAIPDVILNKPGRFVGKEYGIMQNHTILGGEILDKVLSPLEDSNYYEIAKVMAVYHHEKWDGSGYPYGLKGSSIPLPARIMAVADVFDALISRRSYKRELPFEKAFRIIQDGMSTQFDPIIIKAFVLAKENLRKEVLERCDT